MRPVLLGIVMLVGIFGSPAFAQDDFFHHELKVAVVPAEHRLTVSDDVTVPQTASREMTFLLHRGLNPSSPTSHVVIEKLGEQEGAVPLEVFRVLLPEGLQTFTVEYAGTINHPLTGLWREQARGFADTPGTVSAEGVFLSGTSAWYPDFGAPLFTFDLEVRLPDGWDGVSQGARGRHHRGKKATIVRWMSPEPQDSIYLVAAPFTEYLRAAGRVESMVFLRTPDRGLADRYLEATGRYLAMYDKLIGPYAYQKFALVENFWETGFGMPSFTLLGPRVIRLPFIINTSYPHEILHNWWGNGVYVDYDKGNWSEGLTAYLADHLLREQQGAGPEYRVATLQKYADYVRGNKDFPLDEFHSRHSPSTEAVGYGKSLMFFHMLRLELGDGLFRAGFRALYRDYKFRFASFDDVRKSFESVSGKDLKQDFDQWVTRTGAPALRIGKVAVVRQKTGFLLTALLEQVQPGAAYHLRVPVAVTVEGQERAYQTTVDMDGKQQELGLHLPNRPLRLDVDPEYDVFRRLGRDEIPPAVSQALGAKKMLVLLPAKADKELLAEYREFGRALARSGPDDVEVKLDSEVKALPSDRAITVMGWENRYVPAVLEALFGYDLSVKDGIVRIEGTPVPVKDHSFVLTARLPRNRDMALSLIASDRPGSLPGLAAKLPHYHKYSYLAFEGPEPVNVAKGRWPVLNSPLTIFLPGAAGRVEMGALTPRKALTDSDPPFSRERMMHTVRFLTSNSLEGRGFGSTGLEKAAAYIAQAFREAGLFPAGDKGSYYQSWNDRGGDPPRTAVLRNVIGIIPGTDRALNDECVVVGAHYDHLGLGWPESRDRKPGRIHPGADDNASGVAVLIELARVMTQGQQPGRTVVFAAFSGEEAGRRGSRHYVEHESDHSACRPIGMVNLDTVGRLGRNRLLVLGADSAKEWPSIFRAAGLAAAVDVEAVSSDLDSSDQKSFMDAGVPAVQIFSGPNLDYHRTTDTADKIDAAGLVKTASVAGEAVEYLAVQQGPLTPTLVRGKSTEPAIRGSRAVSLGTVPDFAYTGKGVRLAGVAPGSPAEAGGLHEGDIITGMNSRDVGNLRDLSGILRTLRPGDKAVVTFLRNGVELTVETTVRGR